MRKIPRVHPSGSNTQTLAREALNQSLSCLPLRSTASSGSKSLDFLTQICSAPIWLPRKGLNHCLPRATDGVWFAIEIFRLRSRKPSSSGNVYNSSQLKIPAPHGLSFETYAPDGIRGVCLGGYDLQTFNAFASRRFDPVTLLRSFDAGKRRIHPYRARQSGAPHLRV